MAKFTKGSKHSEATKARMRRAQSRRREIEHMVASVAPSDIRKLEVSGVIAPALRPHLAAAEREAAEVLEALGGADSVSPQRRVLVEDLARVGVVLRGTLAAYAESADSEFASKIGTLAGARRSLLSTIGLERHEKTLDLQTYLALKAQENASARAGGANGSAPDVVDAEPAETAESEAT